LRLIATLELVLAILLAEGPSEVIQHGDVEKNKKTKKQQQKETNCKGSSEQKKEVVCVVVV
jgi:hypothetical protein